MNLSDLASLEWRAQEMLMRRGASDLPIAEVMELVAAIPALIATLHRERGKRAEMEEMLNKLVEAHEANSGSVRQAHALLGRQDFARALQAGDCVTKQAWGEQWRTIQLIKQTTAQGFVAVFVEGGWAPVSELKRVK